MILTSNEAKKLANATQEESAQNYLDRVGFDDAESHYRSEFITKAKDFVALFNEIDGDFDAEAMQELVIKAQFLAIRGDAYAEVKNNKSL